MSPLIPLLPPSPPVMPAVTSVSVTGASHAVVAYAYMVEPRETHLGSPLPDGIEFDRWTPLVSPAPRHAFRDSLELLAFDDDE